MREALFDLSDEYDAMLNRGISLSGENRAYFIAGRIRDLKAQLPVARLPRRILDFGCGAGETTEQLLTHFQGAEVVGIDTSENALKAATRRYGSGRVRFQTIDEFRGREDFDVCYVNGVFHHIEPPDRSAALQIIYRSLAPGGYLALFENNPWNPGARLVMHRIPFDRDARPLSPIETKRLLGTAGFRGLTVRSLFYFPRPLSWLRFLEPFLVRLPLGAQYYVLAVK